jgi:multidrug efflux pump subunit AcrB
MLLLILLSMGLAAAKLVVLKMLPFDNKSEFQIIVDMPEGTALERTAQVLGELGRFLQQVPEVRDYQVYAGTAAPINFNGLVRQYYLREGAHLGDIQVNLVDRRARERKSHEIASAVRAPLQAIGRRFDANVKIVEVPPGPPVLSPLVAEIYGLDYQGQIDVAKQVRAVFEATPDIVDVDDSVEAPAPQLRVHRRPRAGQPAGRLPGDRGRCHRHRAGRQRRDLSAQSRRQVSDPAAAGVSGGGEGQPGAPVRAAADRTRGSPGRARRSGHGGDRPT